MENTSCEENCPFVKQGFCKTENECANYIETWWIEPNSQTPKKIKDCSPKRMILQQQMIQSRLEYVEQALEQSRNMYNDLMGYLVTLIEVSKTVILKESEIKLLELQNAKNLDLNSSSLD